MTVTGTATKIQGKNSSSLPFVGPSHSNGNGSAFQDTDLRRRDKDNYRTQLAYAATQFGNDYVAAGTHYLAAARIARDTNLGFAFKKKIKRKLKSIEMSLESIQGVDASNRQALRNLRATLKNGCTPEQLNRTINSAIEKGGSASKGIIDRLEPLIRDARRSRSDAAAKASLKCFLEAGAIREAMAVTVEFDIKPSNFWEGRNMVQQIITHAVFHGQGDGRELTELAVSMLVGMGRNSEAMKLASSNGFPEIAQEVSEGRFTLTTTTAAFINTNGMAAKHNLQEGGAGSAKFKEAEVLMRPLSLTGPGLVSAAARAKQRLPVPNPEDGLQAAREAFAAHMHNGSSLAAQIVAKRYLGKREQKEALTLVLRTELKHALIGRMHVLLRGQDTEGGVT